MKPTPIQLRVTRENLVPLRVLAPYFILGLLSFALAPVPLGLAQPLLELGAYRHPLALAAAHLYTLGWGTTIALGSLQQLSPVLAGSTLWSSHLSRRGLLAYFAGLLSLMAALSTYQPAFFIAAGILLPLAAALVIANIMLTQRGAPMTRQGLLVRPFLLSAVCYLLATTAAGGALAVHFATGWLGTRWQMFFTAHTTFGVVGWFLMLVIGVSYHMLPFFGLTEKKRTPRWVIAVRYGMHAGIWLILLGTVFGWPTSALGALAIAFAMAAFLWEQRALFAPRLANRMHPIVGYVRAGHIYLALSGIAALWLLMVDAGRFPTAVVLVAFLTLAGWLSNTILGYLHRILPFFVWHNKYWGRGREPGVPAFRHMVDLRTAWVGLIVYNVGIVAVLISWLTPLPLQPALVLLGLGGLIAAGNLLRVLWT